ncbi:flagellar basal body rod protein FlgB [Peribacillus saganii]|uniref:Flagellar basal body rod protein FlgB n=1 Tax=Peribacillus saganii TaxID=2303992 RepID=A0A372LU00_9BACI|nr:flagellar basal body rod protein FlgB [Peribacillus saganii]RFU71280.1 flagellar basal body rod protein FlgB [Peribacillus saganii]
MKLFSGSFNLLEQSLNYSSLKQKVISDNISNADTPNYKAKGVNFNSVLDDAIKASMQAYKTDTRHFSFKQSLGTPGVFTKNGQYNHNGNSVDVDKEMSDLASNQIYYNALVDRISGKFQTLQNVVKGGR